MMVYADSNFLTRCYLWLEALPVPELLLEELGQRGETLPIFWLHTFEVTNAFEQHVFQSHAGGDYRVTQEMAAAAQSRFLDDLGSGEFPLQEVVLPPGLLRQQFADLSLRHTAKHGFRTYDLLHVSAALLLGCDTFWSFDAKCSKLAKLEGLKTLRRPAGR